MIEEAHITVRNISMLIVLRVLQYPILILFVLIVPQMMGPETYGKYAFFVSLFTILAASARLGTTETLGRFVPEFVLKQDKPRINKLVFHILLLRASILIIAGIILLSIIFLTQTGEEIKLYLIILIAGLVLGIEGTLYSLLYGFNDIGKFTARDLIRRLSNLLLIIVMFKYFDLFGAVISILISELILLIFVLFWTKKYLSFKDFGLDFIFIKSYFKFGFLFYVTSLLLVFQQCLGSPLIQFITKNSSEVAFYDLANQIYLITSSFMFCIFSAMIPVFTTLLIKKREDKIIKWSCLIMKYAGIIGIIIFSSVLLIGHNLIVSVFGIEYEKVYTNLLILFIGFFAYSISQIGVVYSIVYKQPKKYLTAMSISLIIFLIIALLLIPKYFSIGGSIATLFSILALGVILCIQFRHFIMKVIKPFLKSTALGLILILFVYYGMNLMSNLQWLILFLVFYLSLLFIFKYITIYEIKELVEALKGKQPKD